MRQARVFQASSHLTLPDTYCLVDADIGMRQDAKGGGGQAGLWPGRIDAWHWVLPLSKVELIKISTLLCSVRILGAGS